MCLEGKWIARAEVAVSNVFETRPTGTDFNVDAVIVPYSESDWGKNTFGSLREAELNDLILDNSVLGLSEAIVSLNREFEQKLETRFPRPRFHGNCALSRLGFRL